MSVTRKKGFEENALPREEVTKFQNKVWVFENKDTFVTVRKSKSVKKKRITVFFQWNETMQTHEI